MFRVALYWNCAAAAAARASCAGTGRVRAIPGGLESNLRRRRKALRARCCLNTMRMSCRGGRWWRQWRASIILCRPRSRRKRRFSGTTTAKQRRLTSSARKNGLPQAISGHQNYFLWGPRNYTGEIVIVIGEGEDHVREEFASVGVGATMHNPYALWYENQPILLCRGMKRNLQEIWPHLKYWR